MNTNPGGESGGGGAAKDSYAEWLRVGTYTLSIATIAAEIAAIAWHDDNDGALSTTRKADERAARTLKEAVDHLAASPLLAENQRLRELLREVTEAFTVRYPSAEQGQAAQTAWVMRQSKAVESARAALSKDQA